MRQTIVQPEAKKSPSAIDEASERNAGFFPAPSGRRGIGEGPFRAPAVVRTPGEAAPREELLEGDVRPLERALVFHRRVTRDLPRGRVAAPRCGAWQNTFQNC